MPEVSLQKRLTVVRLFLEGWSYDEISTRAGVGKGTVASIVNDLKAGHFPEAHDLREQVEILREVAVEFRRSSLTVGQVAAGLTCFQRLVSLGVEPEELERFVALCQRLAAQGEGMSPDAFARTALQLHRLLEERGLDLAGLEAKVANLTEMQQHLEGEGLHLQPMAQQVHGLREELDGLEGAHQTLLAENAELEGQRDALREEVAKREERERELSKRVHKLEERAHAVDKRLAVARRATGDLAAMGLSPDDLQGLSQRLAAIAERHRIVAADLRHRLITELEKMDEGLGLEALVETRKQQLAGVEADLERCCAERDKLQGAIVRQRGQQRQLEASLVVLREQASAQIQKAGKEAAAAVRQGAEVLKHQLDTLMQDAMEVAGKVGQLEADLRSHDWLKLLMALVEGKDDLKPQEVRKVALILIASLHAWLEQHRDASPPMAQYTVDSLLHILQGWK